MFRVMCVHRHQLDCLLGPRVCPGAAAAVQPSCNFQQEDQWHAQLPDGTLLAFLKIFITVLTHTAWFFANTWTARPLAVNHFYYK